MDRRVASVLALVEAQPDTDVPTLARNVNLSPSRLRHLFRSDMSTSLCRYIIRCRLLQAQRLLTSSFLSVKQVCSASGFGDTNHFIRVFRRTFAMSPSAYRRAAIRDRK